MGTTETRTFYTSHAGIGRGWFVMSAVWRVRRYRDDVRSESGPYTSREQAHAVAFSLNEAERKRRAKAAT